MKQHRRSIIWTMPKNEFEAIVKKSTSISAIVKYFGFSPTGTHHKMVQQRCTEENIDLSHIPLGNASNKGRQFDRALVPLEDVMVQGSTYSRSSLKKRLIQDGFLEERCSICCLLPFWNNKKLVLRLDHINGDPTDHRGDNLRLVCPNCDSQSDTYCGRKTKVRYFCKCCPAEITKESQLKMCVYCVGKTFRRVERPSFELLQLEIEELGYKGTGKKYGVRDNTIRKWVRSFKKEQERLARS